MSSRPALGSAVSLGGSPRHGVSALRWAEATFWGVLAVAGQAFALRLIDAGKLIHYQHYQPPAHPFASAVIVAQAAAVVIGLVVRRSQVARWLGQFRLWQIGVVVLAVTFPSVALSRDIGAYVTELGFAAAIQLVNVAGIALFAASLPAAAIEWLTRRFHGGFGAAAAAALWVTVVSAVFAVTVYDRHPHVEDEVDYYIHAHMLAAGHLTLPAPPVPKAFEVYLIDVEHGRRFPVTPPGWPAALAVGFLLGVPWLVNPVLAGINVLLSYCLLSELYSRRTALIGVMLLAIAPWNLFLAMSFMTHIFATTCALTAAIGIAWARKTGRLGWACVAGAGAGMVSLVRPLEGMILAVLLGMWAIGLGGKRLRLPALAAFIAATALTGSLMLVYNQHVSGNAKVFPLMAYTDKYFAKNSNALGFGPDRGRGWNWAIDPYPGHGLRDVLVNSELNAFGLNTELFGWSAGSLLLAAAALAFGKRQRMDWAMAAAVAGVVIGNAFYWFSGGPDFGARYWFLALLPLVALSARGLEALESRRGGDRALSAVLALGVISVVTYVPWRAVDKYNHYLRMRPDVIHLAKNYDFGDSLVLIRGQRFPDYASAAVYNPLDLRARVPIYAWDANEQARREVIRAYNDRKIWIVDGPTRTPDGAFRVAGGPLREADTLK